MYSIERLSPSVARLMEIAEARREIIDLFASDPVLQKSEQVNLAITLHTIGEVQQDLEQVLLAVAMFRQAIKDLSEMKGYSRTELRRAMFNFGSALKDAARLGTASPHAGLDPIALFEEAIETLCEARNGLPLDAWSSATDTLGNTYRYYSRLQNSPFRENLLMKSISYHLEARRARRTLGLDAKVAESNECLAHSHLELAFHRENPRVHLEKAMSYIEESILVFERLLMTRRLNAAQDAHKKIVTELESASSVGR